MLLRSSRVAAVCVLFSGITAASAQAGIFGTSPIPISVGPGGEGANGPSGGADISGDNRKARLVAFHSVASNLVSGDSNGVSDVFVWYRPGGDAGLRLSGPARPAGGLELVSVSSDGRQSNGASYNPSVDGSVKRSPHCVAFQSDGSNLAGGDADNVSDVFVRDLRSKRTLLVSRGIGAPAVNPSITGDCRQVAFEAGGQVWIARVRGGRPRSLGAGARPDCSMDGSALVWERGGGVMLRRAGRTTTVTGSGRSPVVSDSESGLWAVSFESSDQLSGNDRNPGADVYMRTFRRRGGARRTDLVSAQRRGAASLGGQSRAGGLTAYAARRGIVTFATDAGGGSTLYYRNNNSGNIDDLAHASAGAISEIATSARANFVAFSSSFAGFPHDGNGGVQDVFFKHLVDGAAL
jgi:hypothetical protein